MIHYITYRVFVYGTENEVKVIEAINTIFPTSVPEKKLAKGHFKIPVMLLYKNIKKKKNLDLFINKLRKLESNQKKIILRELKNKIDDNGNLFLRFDKQEAFLGNMRIVNHGNSIHVKIKIAAYPAKNETIMKSAVKLFGEDDVF
jgi:RNA-binding protein